MSYYLNLRFNPYRFRFKCDLNKYMTLPSLKQNPLLINKGCFLKQHRCLAISETISRRAKSMIENHQNILEKINEINEQGSGNQLDISINLSKELSNLAPLVRCYEKLESILEEKKSITELLRESKMLNDKGMIDECESELSKLNSLVPNLEVKIVNAVLPVDDDFYDDAILEIRAGTGGDEVSHDVLSKAGIFASELLASYEKTVKGRGWLYEVLTMSKSDIGGIREAAISIISNKKGGFISSKVDSFLDGEEETSVTKYGPYGYFKFESGVHRVQRIPVNDVRIHTSTASVAVLPTSSDSSLSTSNLPASELRIETMRASGAGGQHVNTTDSAVRITHIPTGVTASIQDERSQHKNKAKALKLINARVRDLVLNEKAKKHLSEKNLLMGGGDRSERVRTYNFPQDRVTDHRLKHTEHGIEYLMNGGTSGLVGLFAPKLMKTYREEQLNLLEEEN